MRKRYPEKYKEVVNLPSNTHTPFNKITGIGVAYIDNKVVSIDKNPYAKVYLEFVDIVSKESIGLPAVRMLFFILKKLKVGSDVVRFTVLAAKAHTGYKADKSIYEGLVDLIKMGVIARKDGTEEEYFINPQYIFRGKRDKLLDDGVEIE